MVVKNWRKLIKRAWSLRLMGLAAILTGAEACIPVLEPYINQQLFALIMFGLISSAFVARLVAQKEFKDDKDC